MVSTANSLSKFDINSAFDSTLRRSSERSAAGSRTTPIHISSKPDSPMTEQMPASLTPGHDKRNSSKSVIENLTPPRLRTSPVRPAMQSMPSSVNFPMSPG